MSYSSSSLDREPLAYASLLSGLFSCLLAYLCGCFTIVLSVTAITCGVIYLIRNKDSSEADSLWAKGGIVLGVIGLILYLVLLFAT